MIVADTNVVSELMRPEPAAAVVDWLQRQSRRDIGTTAITVAEVLYGVARLPDGHRRDLLGATAPGVFDAFADRVLPFDAAAARRSGEILRDRERAGRPMSGFDAQIAAICAVRGARLATRSTKDFADTGIDLVDPWTDGR